MKCTATTLAAAAALVMLAGAAQAQSLEIGWWTIDGGGGVASGPSLTVIATIGQPDAGTLAGTTLTLRGGFWFAPGEQPCPGDYNEDGAVDTRDVLAFLNAWAAGDPRADANDDGLIDSRDVLAFLNLWTTPCA